MIFSRDLGSLVVSAAGSLAETGDPWEPYRLTGPDGARVEAVPDFLRDLQAAGRPATTQRSYGLALLRWFRFTWAVDVPWDQATRTGARDFCRWVQLAGKPGGARAAAVAVPGRRPASAKYASSTVAHCETACRGFYSYHVEAGTGPLVNPFPLARPGRANAHRNPVDPFGGQRAGLFRPRVPRRLPRQIPDEVFNELFARLGSHRDRALVAFWVSSGARASELPGVLCSGADPGQQLITVIRKGSRAMQQLPASPDAFVWLRLYQQQMRALVPAGPDDPLWWTLRRPFRPPGNPVAPARRSAAAQAKASCQHDPAGQPCRSFRSLLEHLATLTRNQVRYTGTHVTIAMLTEPTSTQRQAFELIGVPIPLTLK